ncbi:MAG: SpoIIIAH-like family protein [Oscillospiraceae bacterium]|nr:SpoIIIAH-like family protein [Oscillospiraceae bacterium]
MTNILRKIKRIRINMIIGKKQIVIAGLTLLLGIAVYVNYVFASSNNQLTDTAVDAGDVGASYGDVQFVSGGSLIDDDISAYFAQARLNKRESRDEAKEFLQSMAFGGDVLAEELQVIARDASNLSGYIESESKIESILKAQGFADVLCYISDRGANIIVRTDGLTPQDAAKIKDALLSEVSVPVENITIVEIR